MMRVKPMIAAVFMVMSVVMSGCSGPAVRFDMSSTASLNMDEGGQPLPVVVRVYQLGEVKGFENAPFTAMWKDDIRTLGDAALTRQEIVINPGATKRVEIPRNDLATHVGVVALFRDPDGDKWRATLPLSTSYVGKKLSVDIAVNLGSRSVKINK